MDFTINIKELFQFLGFLEKFTICLNVFIFSLPGYAFNSAKDPNCSAFYSLNVE